MAYEFDNSTFDSVPVLVSAMESRWEKGKKFLFDGSYRTAVSGDKSLASSALFYERKYREDPSKGNLLFLRWLVKMPGKKELCWMGHNYGSLEHIGKVIGSDKEENLNKLVLLMIQEQIFGDFAQSSGAGEHIAANVRYLERFCGRGYTKFNRDNILPILRGILEDRRTFKFEGHEFKTAEEFAAYLQKFADLSKKELSAKAGALYQDDFNLIPEFEVWLLNLGYQRAVTSWRERFQAVSEDEEAKEGAGPIDLVKLEDIEAGAENGADGRGAEEDAEIFADLFTAMLRDHPESLESEQRLSAFMNDMIPESVRMKYLITALYRMDIVKAIKEADILTDLFTSRFIMRMKGDFGISEDLAGRAVSMWCVCYGERTLGKKNYVREYRR